MRHLIDRRILVHLLAVLVFFTSGWLKGNEDDSRQSEMESFLQSASIQEVIKNLEGGRTEYWDVILIKDGTERRARFKYIDRRRPLPIADSFLYELAAYELNKLLGQHIVPPLVRRTIEEMEGSLQIFIPDCVTESYRTRKNIEPPDESFDRKLKDIKIFEYLTGDPCYDVEDILVNCNNWELWRVDFSEAFSDTFSPNINCKITGCSRTLYVRLKSLEEKTIRSVLQDFLNPSELDALLQRKTSIVDTLERLIAERGEERVLF